MNYNHGMRKYLFSTLATVAYPWLATGGVMAFVGFVIWKAAK